MQLKADLMATLETTEDTPALLQIEIKAQQGLCDVTDARLTVGSAAGESLEQLCDLYGNLCRRVILQGGQTQITYNALIDYAELPAAPSTSSDPRQQVMSLTSEALHYLLPSRYCPSDRMLGISTDLFGAEGPSIERVQHICEWINTNVRYQYGTSDSSTSAIDTLLERSGVCRDFSHLAITFCRALTIPARYVSGFCLGLDPPDLHAYFEAFIDGIWVPFDATSQTPRNALLDIAYGRDAADCAWCTIYGNGQTTNLSVAVTQIDQ